MSIAISQSVNADIGLHTHPKTSRASSYQILLWYVRTYRRRPKKRPLKAQRPQTHPVMRGPWSSSGLLFQFSIDVEPPTDILATLAGSAALEVLGEGVLGSEAHRVIQELFQSRWDFRMTKVWGSDQHGIYVFIPIYPMSRKTGTRRK